MAEKCPCEIYKKSCCACVSVHCDNCHGHSEFVQGRFCSNCGRPLKAELTQLYVPKSEVADLQDELKCEKETNEHLIGEYNSLLKENARLITLNEYIETLRYETLTRLTRDIIDEVYEKILTDFPDSSFVNAPLTTYQRLLGMVRGIKQKYTGEI